MLAAFAPIWALTAVGFLVGVSRALGPAAVDVLGRFVFTVAMPAALFGMLVHHPLSGFAGRGHRPSLDEAAARLTRLRDRGPTPDAFTPRAPFRP